MNKRNFTKILSDPDLVSEETLSMLKEIIDEYPFFQIGRMLMLKDMHKIDHIRYNSELKHSAVYIPDRTKLFFLLNNIGNDRDENENNQNIFSRKQESVQSADVIKEHSIKEEHSTQRPLKEVVEVSNSDITATDNYLNASDEYIDETGSLETLTFSKGNSNTNKKEDEFDDVVFPAADLLDYESTSSSLYSLPDLKELSEVDSSENRSFSDWLHIMHYSNPEQTNEPKKEKKKGMDLIDNFLSQDPKIVPSASKKSKNVDLSEQKDGDSEDILSETLATIYIKQGHKSKAISIFDKLRLKYPEKSVYFARRISELKEIKKFNI